MARAEDAYRSDPGRAASAAQELREVLAHFPPEDTYNSRLEPSGLIKAQRKFAESDVLDEFLCLFGPGDGGGGPKDEHLRRLERVSDLAGCPRVKPGRADAFFDRLSRRADELETWVGELYLELHRGTLTTQAQVKKHNRLLENLLQAVEMLSSLLEPADWPREELDAIWKTVLRNQFHDILPGSSVKDVYEKTLDEYRDCTQRLEVLLGKAATKLLAPDGDAVTLMNTTSYPSRGLVRMPADWAQAGAVDAQGNALPAQVDDEGLWAAVDVPALGFATVHKSPPVAAAVEETRVDQPVLKNELVRYVFAADGRLVEAFDKEVGRDILAEGEAGNVLSLYADTPAQWEAWDVDIFYQEQFLERARSAGEPVLRRGPVRQEIEFTLGMGQSKIRQKVRLEAGSKRQDFVTEVDGSQQRRMLRTAFAVDVMSDRATFDIQYGQVQRPAHSNNSWDMAQFEFAGQRYADLSRGDYGVALLSDCKYGYKVRDGVLDMNLLRSPKYPDREGQGFTDQGVHHFTYSLLPHVGGLAESDVLAEAALMNRPIRLLKGKPDGPLRLPCRIESDGVSLEVLKRGEKSDEWVVRLVETLGRRSCATLLLDETVSQRAWTDLLEWTDLEVIEVSRRAEVTLEPFEIRTCKLR